MSRVPRIQIEDAIYYVMPAGNYDEPIFRDDEDYAFYLELLAQYKNKHSFRLFAFCLTPNSISLLIDPSSNATISQIMHDLNPNYTKYFNRKYKRAGRLFKERYHMVLIEKAPNLLKMTAYIHLRPRLLHLTDDINSYKYTSFLKYLTEDRKKPGAEAPDVAQGDKLNMANEVAYVLGCLKDKSYRQFVYETGTGKIEELEKALEKDKIIGSADFRQKVESKINDKKQAPEAAGKSIPIEKPVALLPPIPIQIPKVDEIRSGEIKELEKARQEELAKKELEKKQAEEKARLEREAKEKARQEAEARRMEEQAKKEAERQARLEAEKKARQERERLEEEKALAEKKMQEEAKEAEQREKERIEREAQKKQAPEAAGKSIPIKKQNILSKTMPTKTMPKWTLKVAGRPVPNIWIFTAAAACLVILSFIFSMFFAYANILHVKESMKHEIAKKDIELQNRLVKELDAASKEMSKTYEAKLSSYRTVIERLEAEKRKAEDDLSKAKASLRLRSGALRQKAPSSPAP